MQRREFLKTTAVGAAALSVGADGSREGVVLARRRLDPFVVGAHDGEPAFEIGLEVVLDLTDYRCKHAPAGHDRQHGGEMVAMLNAIHTERDGRGRHPLVFIAGNESLMKHYGCCSCWENDGSWMRDEPERGPGCTEPYGHLVMPQPTEEQKREGHIFHADWDDQVDMMLLGDHPIASAMVRAVTPWEAPDSGDWSHLRGRLDAVLIRPETRPGWARRLFPT